VGVPLRQQLTVGSYLIKQKLKGVKKYPLVLMLEPLFRCNLACAGCGKIDYSDDILDKRLSFEECMQAVDECDAPMVSIPGGEPLIHKEMPQAMHPWCRFRGESRLFIKKCRKLSKGSLRVRNLFICVPMRCC